MKRSSNLRRWWSMARLNPFVDPLMAGLVVLAAVYPLAGATTWWLLLWISWAVLWAALEQLAGKGYPRSRVRVLTPNFYAVRDLGGTWRIFEKRPVNRGPCRAVLGELLRDRQRLPAALVPGRYRALTHDTIVARLQGMANVRILSCRPAYTATLECTIRHVVCGRCRRCAERCPFPGRTRLRTFFDVEFLVF